MTCLPGSDCLNSNHEHISRRNSCKPGWTGGFRAQNPSFHLFRIPRGHRPQLVHPVPVGDMDFGRGILSLLLRRTGRSHLLDHGRNRFVGAFRIHIAPRIFAFAGSSPLRIEYEGNHPVHVRRHGGNARGTGERQNGIPHGHSRSYFQRGAGGPVLRFLPPGSIFRLAHSRLRYSGISRPDQHHPRDFQHGTRLSPRRRPGITIDNLALQRQHAQGHAHCRRNRRRLRHHPFVFGGPPRHHRRYHRRCLVHIDRPFHTLRRQDVLQAVGV